MGETFKRLVFAVTNDLSYDQRMMRICSSLQNNGYEVLLIGRKLKSSIPLTDHSYKQKRLACLFEKGKLFYIEYNIRLFLFLLFCKSDVICAIDLDTILPCYMISIIRNKKRVYDAHELFCEMKEVVTRKNIYRFWKWIERKMLPRFPHGYTVNQPIKDEFYKEYHVQYDVIMNVPILNETSKARPSEEFVIYQGAVNHGRSLETIIPAFSRLIVPLWIFGTGNFYTECNNLIKKYNLEEKVLMKGNVLPAQLKEITPTATLGLNLIENTGINNYLSLANRFFDYIHAGIPQLSVNYPAYKQINDEFVVAVLIEDLSSMSIEKAIKMILEDKELQERLKKNCELAKQVYNWQNEERKLIQFYQRLL